MGVIKDKFGMIWELIIFNVNWKLVKVFFKKLVFNLRFERIIRII